MDEKILPAYFYQNSLGKEPVRDWLKDLDKEDRRSVTVPGLEHPMGFSHLKCSDLEDCGIYHAKKSLQ